jgi:hypothetical protein
LFFVVVIFNLVNPPFLLFNSKLFIHQKALEPALFSVHQQWRSMLVMALDGAYSQ